MFWHAQGAAACGPELGTQKVPALPIGSKLGEYPCMACITWSMGHIAMADRYNNNTFPPLPGWQARHFASYQATTHLSCYAA